MNIIADVTKAHEATVPQVLAKLAKATDMPSITVLLHDDQLPQLAMVTLNNIQTKSISRTTSVPEVALEMALAAASDFPLTVVFSFHSNVIAMEKRLYPEARRKVLFAPWSAAASFLRNAGAQTAATASEVSWSRTPIPDGESFALIKEVLIERGAFSEHTAIKKTALRGLLSSRDPRFFKAHPAASAPHFISALVARAERAQVLKSAYLRDNAAIWLAEQQTLDFVPAAPAKPNIPAVCVPTAAAASSVAAASAANEPAPTTAPWERYTDILEASGMGPFANFRDELYDALETLARQGHRMDTLITQCMACVRERHKEDPQKRPWSAIRDFLMRLLMRRPVLIDESANAVSPSFLSLGSIIKDIRSTFREELDGELVLFLLERGAEITFMDSHALVGTLYMTREPENEGKMFRAISHLQKSGLINSTGEAITLTAKGGKVALVKSA